MRATSTAFRSDVHGLRAVAVVLVLLEHAHFAVPGGFVGVDVFFVISGFLITGHLLRELDARGRIDLRGFWARRVRRILPSAVLVALVTFAAGLVLLPPLVVEELTGAAAASLLSVPNLFFAARGTDYLSGDAPSPFQHYWSLGVEEQFYLVWPFVLLVTWWLVRRRSLGTRYRTLSVAIVVIVLVSFVLGLVLTGRSQPWAFFSLPSRAWELALGALVALAVHRGHALRGAAAGALAWLGLAGILLAAFVYDSRTTYPGIAVLLPVASSAALIWAGTAAVGGPRVVLGLQPFRYLGRISYALYLWHWPVLVLPQAAVGLGHPLPVWAVGGLLLVAVLLAALTTTYLEEPLRTVGRSDLRAVAVGLAASATATALVLGLGATAPAGRPLHADRDAAPASPSVSSRFTTYVPANLDPGLADATVTTSQFREQGCHNDQTADLSVNDCVLGDANGALRVAIVGDSHAAHWVPGLEEWAARTGGVRLSAYTKNACTMADVRVRDAGRHYRECDTWRAAVVDRLAGESPDVILVAGSSHLQLVDGGDRQATWREGLRRTLAALPASSRVSVVADTPEFAESVPRCLSAHLEDAERCDVERERGVDASWLAMERAETLDAGHTYVDLTDWFCTTTRCGTISGNTLMYRDHGHLTEAWARSLWEQIGGAVAAAR